MSICVFLVINLLFFYDPRWEHPILSWQWYRQSVFWDQFNILSDLINCQNWNQHPFPFTLSGFNTIQRKYEYFSFLSLISYSQLSVSNWRKERKRWSDPVPYFFAPLILPISLGLPAFPSLSPRLAAEDNSFHNVWSFYSELFCVFLYERTKNVERSQSIHFLYWEINERNSAVSSLLWQASKSLYRRTVCLYRQTFAFTLWQFIRQVGAWSKTICYNYLNICCPFCLTLLRWSDMKL